MCKGSFWLFLGIERRQKAEKRETLPRSEKYFGCCQRGGFSGNFATFWCLTVAFGYFLGSNADRKQKNVRLCHVRKVFWVSLTCDQRVKTKFLATFQAFGFDIFWRLFFYLFSKNKSVTRQILLLSECRHSLKKFGYLSQQSVETVLPDISESNSCK